MTSRLSKRFGRAAVAGLFLLVSAAAAFGATDVVFLVDGSGSIDAVDFELERQGIRTALQNSATLPRDGSIAVAIVQFGNGSTRTEVPYTRVSSEADLVSVLTRLAAMSQIGGGTNPGDAVQRATTILNGSGRPGASQSLCLATDGLPNTGVDLPPALTAARNSAIGVDRFGVIAVEDPPNFYAADFINYFTPLVFGGSNVTVVRNAAEFANTVGPACLTFSPLELVGLEVSQAVQDWRNTVRLIKGKETWVRAHVQDPRGGNPVVVARLRGLRGSQELAGSPLVPSNPGGSIYAPVDANAVRGQLNRSLNFQLPAAWTDGTVTLRLEGAGSVLTCKEAAGTANDCAAAVSFVAAETPEVELVQVDIEEVGIAYQVSNSEVTEVENRLVSTWPAASIAFRHDRLKWPADKQVRTHDVTEKVNWLRLQDLCWRPFCDRFYYGVMKQSPSSAGDWGGEANGIPGESASGYYETAPFLFGRHRATHEIGHLLGIHHADPGCLRPGMSSPQSLAYEYGSPHGTRVPTLGPMGLGKDRIVYGLDTHAQLAVDPNDHFELMGYCEYQNGYRWPSAITYDRMFELSQAQFDFGELVAMPKATAAPYVLVRGQIAATSGAVTFLPFGRLMSPVAPPVPPAGPYTLKAYNAGGQTIATVSFEPSRGDGQAGPQDLAYFHIALPADPGLRRIEILRGGAVVAQIAASANPPTVTVAYPNGGEQVSAGVVNLRWQGSDPDGQALRYTVQYSSNSGADWNTLAVDLVQQSYDVDRRRMPGGNAGRLRVIASDGFWTSLDDSNANFTVANNAPEIQLASPRSGDVYVGVQRVVLDALAQDPEDGVLAGTRLRWRSSLDGNLGTGPHLELLASDLREGEHEVTLTATDSRGAATTSTVRFRIARIGFPACLDEPDALCLNSRRFRTEIDWNDGRGHTGRGQVAPFRSDDSGLFWFFQPDNLEVLIKVLDGCSNNGHFWVFAAATTDVQYSLRVTDNATGSVKTYVNALGNASRAITDSTAFATCDAVASAATASVTVVDLPAGEPGWQALSSQVALESLLPKAAYCTDTTSALCLASERFEVSVTWRTPQGQTGSAKVVPQGTDDSGLFYFFSANNWEMLVKVLNGCGLNNRYWVYAAATTDVQYTLRVADRKTGLVKEYFNPQGVAAPAITDSSAFASCP